MPAAWSNKDERQYEHIVESAKEQGRSEKRAKSIAAATVNKQRSKEGRTKEQQERRGSAPSSESDAASRSADRSERAAARSEGAADTKKALYARAAKANIPGRSRMTRPQLQAALSREKA